MSHAPDAVLDSEYIPLYHLSFLVEQIPAFPQIALAVLSAIVGGLLQINSPEFELGDCL